jgi:hypothetical protein
MTKDIVSSGDKLPVIRKQTEFEAFVKTLETGARAHWSDIAEALGISRDTIMAWRRDPRAIAVTRDGISKALVRMQKSGRSDWRMWHEKLKMLKMVKEQTAPSVAIQINFGSKQVEEWGE